MIILEMTRTVPPWKKWEALSEKAQALDTIGKGCAHQFYWIPYTIDYLIESKISIKNLSCQDQHCRAVDQFHFENDILHISKFCPKPIRAVNRNSCFVVNRQGVLQGPFEHHEWLSYSWVLWDLFHDILEEKVQFDSVNAKQMWSSLYFRYVKDFTAGSYNHFSEIHLLLANAFPDRDTKHSCYSELHSGADLWINLEPTDIKDAKQFRNEGKIFNVSVPHKTNCKIRNLKVEDSKTILSLREERKNQLKELKNRLKSNCDELSNMIPKSCKDHMEAWYPALKHIPFRVDGKKVSSAVYPNNERHINDHWDTVIKCLSDFLQNGAIKLMPEDYYPPMACSLVLANADNPHKKVRPCHDGGSLKTLEAFKAPCKLEGIPEILNILKKGDLMTKLDDSKGFHLLQLHPESRDLCNFEFAGRIFQYVVLPFGERKSPHSFQKANFIPLNYCRARGLTVSLYLDDRLIVEPQQNQLSNSIFEPHSKYDPFMAKNTFLVCALIVATGGFINLEKSVFIPTMEEEFLGFMLNTKTATISIPNDKWKRFQESLDNFLKTEYMTLEQMEQLRGQMCSFLVSSRYLKVFIRRQTEAIKQVYADHKHEIHHFFKNEKIKISDRIREEFQEWKHATTLELTRCWLPPKEQNKDVYVLHTDASLSQLGGVLFKGEVFIGEFKMPFSVDIAHWSIAAKEMLAIFYCLLHFGRFLKDAFIINFCDNQQSCYAFTLDGSRNPLVNDLLIKIYRILHILNAEIKVYWIPTTLQIGDEPSRVIELSEEFIPTPIFKEIEKIAGFQFDVDVMASVSNFKCEKFLVRANNGIPHPGIIGYDFLHFDYSKLENKVLYVFPPKVLLQQVTAILAKHFKQHRFVLVYHQFQEQPLGCESLLAWRSSRLVNLSHRKAISFIPSEEMRILKCESAPDFHFNGSPNIRPKSTNMIINDPFLSSKRKNENAEISYSVVKKPRY